jgi:hypothetical protein
MTGIAMSVDRRSNQFRKNRLHRMDTVRLFLQANGGRSIPRVLEARSCLSGQLHGPMVVAVIAMGMV